MDKSQHNTTHYTTRYSYSKSIICEDYKIIIEINENIFRVMINRYKNYFKDTHQSHNYHFNLIIFTFLLKILFKSLPGFRNKHRSNGYLSFCFAILR